MALKRFFHTPKHVTDSSEGVLYLSQLVSNRVEEVPLGPPNVFPTIGDSQALPAFEHVLGLHRPIMTLPQ